MKLMSDNISNVAKALVAAQKEMGNAVKDSKNPFFKSSYADLNAVREAVLPACNANGISVLQPTIFVDGKKFVQTILLHESGEFVSGVTEVLSVKELDAQAQGSGISYARRYGLQSIANVGAEDDDGNSASGKQAPPLRAAAKTEEKKEETKTAVGGITGGASAEPSTGRKSFRKQPQTGSEDL